MSRRRPVPGTSTRRTGLAGGDTFGLIAQIRKSACLKPTTSRADAISRTVRPLDPPTPAGRRKMRSLS